MRFLADMGVSLRVVQWLRGEGHDAVHLREEGLHKLPNGEIFKKAHSEQRTLLTFDLDFSEIVALSGGCSVTAIVFRLRITTTLHVIERLKKVLKDSREGIERGAIIIVEESRHRIRRFPFSV
ncbi:MAG: DUF5615 family PIN-like protein [Spirochaetota bacterium]